MKRITTLIACLVLVLLSTALFAEIAAIQKPVQTTIKPPISIKPELLKSINTANSINASTAPNMSVAWHAPVTTNQIVLMGMVAVDKVDGGRIFSNHIERSSSSSASKFVVRAVRAVDGTELWRTEEPPTSPACGCPISIDGKLLINFGSKVRGYDAANGTKLWETSVPGGTFAAWGNSFNGIVYHSGTKRFSGINYATGSYAFSNTTSNDVGVPLAANSVLYVASTNLSAVGPGNGQNPKWSTPMSCQASTPVADKATLYIAGPNNLYCVDAATGTIKWQKAMNTYCSSSNAFQVALTTTAICVLTDSSHLVGCGYKDGAQKWQYTGSGLKNFRPMPVVNDVVFVPGNTMNAVNSLNGQKLWEYNTGKAGYFHSAMAINDDMIVAQFGTEIYVFAP